MFRLIPACFSAYLTLPTAVPIIPESKLPAQWDASLLISLGIGLGLTLLLSWLFPKLARLLARKEHWDSRQVLKGLKPLLILPGVILADWLMQRYATLSLNLQTYMNHLLQSLVLISLMMALWAFLPILLQAITGLRSTRRSRQLQGGILFLLRVMVALLSVFILISLWGIPVGSILTGLGLSSLAVAFAAQDTFSNFFGGATVHLDRPFIEGDLITIDDYTGYVEKIGFRSTTLRTYDERLVIIPNSKLITNFLVNDARQKRRRVALEVYLDADFETAQWETFKSDLLETLSKWPELQGQPSLYLANMDPKGIACTLKFYLKSNRWETYAAYQEKTLLLLLSRLKAQGFHVRYQSLNPREVNL